MSAALPGDLEPLALSSMYFQRWPDMGDLRPFFAAGRAMGFARFELSHDLGPEAIGRLAPGDVRIAVPVDIEIGARVVLYLESLGRIAGQVVRECAPGVAEAQLGLLSPPTGSASCLG